MAADCGAGMPGAVPLASGPSWPPAPDAFPPDAFAVAAPDAFAPAAPAAAADSAAADSAAGNAPTRVRAPPPITEEAELASTAAANTVATDQVTKPCAVSRKNTSCV